MLPSRITTILIALVLLLATSTGIFAWLYFTKPCPPCYDSGKTVIVTKVVPVKDTTLKPIVVKVPEPWGIKPKSAFKPVKHGKPVALKSDTSIRIFTRDCDTTIVLPTGCNDVAYYSDTITGDSVKAVINDTLVNNRIAGRSVWLANLKPEVRTTTTVVKKEKWKFYVGASFTINQRFMNRWGVGPSALVTIPKVGGISYTFDARNFAHTGSFFVLVRLKK
jgi:hypothetical protein